ncbi:alpha/beta hydrolase [Propionivibrio sp.]|uniref:alpha/beta fold hydrolase n=1 Tax=Propionivibrio sp. TaxID=2212460 RepID=UPI0025F2348B|nr:alpha/beta hydrolase [Propionivibrio sp.]MBK7356575.1 alpha/beta hydrolase [Propionivibrio sp.]MBK8400988.1 alpha/beta hydrolase [Propionivibrio sp.]MBK8744159.1 alpha/beta hydrolase [Propionivibrio sp.]MBK8894273.1 alpha/beta hydrolase [Propionivibrio sp.]
MKHQTITADDGELLDIRLTGNGTPILLLHGWTSSHASWAPLIKPLMGRCCLLRPDARAHGGHPLTQPGKPDVQRLARDVINLLDHLGIEKIAAVGHSMGALTLWQCIRDFGTQRFSHLAFIDQSPKLVTTDTWNGGIYSDFNAERAQRMLDDFNADFVEGVLRLIAFGLNDKARETYLRDTAGWRAIRDAVRLIDPAPVIAIWESLVAADYRDVLPTIDVPTLLAHGTASNFYTAETARYIAGRIPHSRLSFYEGADHCPHLFRPERFAAELVELLDRD